MDTATIAQLLEPFANPDEQQLRLTSIYIDLLLKWNARINLTAVRDPEEIVTRHFGESFFAAENLRSCGKISRTIDLGSGAGFPGIPMAILMPETEFTLIEANHKKTTFLREVIFTLGLKNAVVFNGRAEDFKNQANLVTMRAVERFESVLPTALNLVEAQGWIALMIGTAQGVQARALAYQVEWNSPVNIPGGHSRILIAGTRQVKVG